VTWEVDVFEGENAGLIIAEVELAHEQQALDLPPWVGREITQDERYYNSRLVHLPFCHFPADDAAPQERVG
jgi:adenylate cyclase